MATRYLKTDLERIRTIYQNARANYTDLQDKLDELRKELADSQKDVKLTVQGKDAARVRLNEEISKTRAELDTLISNAAQSFQEARKDVDRLFGELYRATPDKLDTNALELLRSDILTDAELSDMADKYADNITMRRLIGKYAQERADRDKGNLSMRKLAASLNRQELPHLEAADGLITWSERGLNSDRVRGDGVAKRYDEYADEIIARYGDICVNV